MFLKRRLQTMCGGGDEESREDGDGDGVMWWL